MNILQKIVEEKQREVALLPGRSVGVSELKSALQSRGDRRDFFGALKAPHRASMALIAEVKKASPSAGIIAPDFDPIRIARDYEAAGADCLSVLTDTKFFQGSLEYLKAIRQAVRLPLLRKDFIIVERQILEAVEWGADAILLIVAILDDERLRRFHTLATEAGLTALVEVHDEEELDRALAIGAPLIGVNNRNLKTFEVSLQTTKRMADRMKSRNQWQNRLLVAESGIHRRSDVREVSDCGARAVLVGESLMRQAGDVSTKIRQLLED